MRWPNYPGWTKVRNVRRAYVLYRDSDPYTHYTRPAQRGWCRIHDNGSGEFYEALSGHGEPVNGADYRMRVG